MKMKTNKEYPATHSSDTAWFCVDLDGNVAVFDIEEDGPTPNDFEWGHCIADMMTECLPSHTEENIYDFPLTDAQIKPMLLPHIFEEDIWNNGYNYYWMDTIIKLDMKKYDVLRKILAHRPGTNPVEHKPGLAVCFSRKNGYFYLDLFDNKEGVEELKKTNAILEVYSAPFDISPYDDDYEDGEDEDANDEEKSAGELCKSFSEYPFFLYHQDYGNNMHPAERVNNPVEPLHISQLPEVLQAKAKKLHLHFSETPAIQLAEHLDIGAVWTVTYEYKGKYWKQLGSPRGGHLYYCSKSREFMDTKVMEKAIASGEAMETNWNNY